MGWPLSGNFWRENKSSINRWNRGSYVVRREDHRRSSKIAPNKDCTRES